VALSELSRLLRAMQGRYDYVLGYLDDHVLCMPMCYCK
jgi:hypothetical protein